ncbi:MAG: amidohydrolase family protein [Spirochaetota bacterium]|nr:amidohydrolase family protein [Spirochaetota bacterium]
MIDYNDYQYFDSHVHFFPKKLLDSIWDYFENNYWPIYLKNSAEDLALKLITEFKIKNFLVLNYAHKPGIAASMNEWTHSFCSSSQLKNAAIPFGTIHPGDKNIIEEMDKIFGEFNFAGVKLQLMVTDFFIHDERMKAVYNKIIEYNRVLLVHVGTGPTYTNYHPGERLFTPFTGVKHLERFMKAYPEMKVIVPHMGAEEYDEMWPLVEIYPNLYFDTAMIGARNNTAFDDEMKDISNEQLYKMSDRILFGSDFPNIPYDYKNSILGWLDRKMEPSFYEKIFYKNAEKIFHEFIK